MAQQEVIREYLMSLGFRVNTTQQRNFDNALRSTGKIAVGVGGALVGVAAAAAVMTQQFANSMEKLYYASRRSDSTAENLQSMSFGAKQIGISGEQMQASIEGMARSLRSNPGLQGVLKSFGVKVDGRDMSDVAKDAVRAFRQMPFYVGEKFANMFGMDSDTFLMMSQGLEKLEEMQALRKKMNEDAGVDVAKATEAGMEFNNQLSITKARLDVLQGALAIALLPTMKDLTEETGKWLTKLTIAVGASHSLGEFWHNLGFGSSGMVDKGEQRAAMGEQEVIGDNGFLNKEANDTLTHWADAFFGIGHGGAAYGANRRRVGPGRGLVPNYGPPPGATSSASDGNGGVDPRQKLMGDLEEQYGLPEGILDSLWAQESGRGTNMTSSTGVVGHFQLTTPNRKAYGVTDPMDFDQEAKGAAAMLADLQKQYKYNLPEILTAWNAGGVGSEKRNTDEARNFAPQVMHRMDQYVQITIKSTDPHGAGVETARELERAKGNAMRDLQGAGQ